MEMSSSQKPRVGFIGLGIMGKQMASNLMKKGYELRIFNRSQKSVEELVAAGAGRAGTPRDLAADCDIVIDMVTDAPDVEKVLLDQKDGLVTGAKKGLVAIDMSTNSPGVARNVYSKLRERGVDFLDAPVTGGDKGAREATLTIMVGGKKEIFERCRPLFEAMGREVVYMGESGSGQAMKLCNQVAVSIHTLATSEALMFATAAGLNLGDALKVLTTGAASSWNLANLGPKIVARDFEPGFKSAHILKDLRYVIQLSEANRVVLPGSSTVYQLLNSVMADGYGEKGTQVLARVLEKLSDREIK